MSRKRGGWPCPGCSDPECPTRRAVERQEQARERERGAYHPVPCPCRKCLERGGPFAEIPF